MGFDPRTSEWCGDYSNRRIWPDPGPEVDLLRAVYRKKFIQISVALDKEARISAQKNLHIPGRAGPQARPMRRKARSLIEQEGVDYGQRVRKIFHLGDVFINGNNLDTIESTINWFMFALFGKTMPVQLGMSMEPI